jgi:hypothetical protein
MDTKIKLNNLFNSLPREKGIEIMKKSKNISEFLVSIEERPGGSGYKRFYSYCEKYKIKYEQYFTHEQIKKPNINKKLEEILVENSTYLSTNNLKKRILKEGVLENKCVSCGNNGTWNGKTLALHLDHINGNHTDNRLENLRILCPNCHAQTETYCGKNVKQENKPIAKPVKQLCSVCNVKEIWKTSKKCKECNSLEKRKVVDRPSKDDLLEQLKTSNYVQLGKKYNVSDNTIRKWLKNK